MTVCFIIFFAKSHTVTVLDCAFGLRISKFIIFNRTDCVILAFRSHFDI